MTKTWGRSLEHGFRVLKYYIKSKSTKEKVDKSNFIKMSNFALWKILLRWENGLQIYKVLVPRTHQELSTLDIIKQTNKKQEKKQLNYKTDPITKVCLHLLQKLKTKFADNR